MAKFSRIRRLFATTTVLPARAARVVRRPGRSRDASQEEALRAELRDDPNDVQAFSGLVDVIRRHTSGLDAESDPLHAPVEELDELKAKAEAASWAVAEEFAGHPTAWYPLVVLARLSLDDDREGALRKLSTAADRDAQGRALAMGIQMLRAAGMPADAHGLGIGHWRLADNSTETARQVVMAALDAGRLTEARMYIEALAAHPDADAAATVRAELTALVDTAERHNNAASPA